MSKRETIRRLLWGDLLTVVRYRYGHTLPDADDGRDDLYLMLRLAAVADRAADKKMRAVIELYAPWAGDAERRWIDELARDDPRRVWLNGKELGQRLNLTNAEREALKVWRIAPVHLDGELFSAAELAELRKAKDRERKAAKRRQSGKRTRPEYLAAIKSTKPEAAGIPRRTWFRRKARGLAPGVSATIVDRRTDTPSATLTKLKGRVAGRGKVVLVSAMSETEGQASASLSPMLASTTDTPSATPVGTPIHLSNLPQPRYPMPNTPIKNL